jgi:hypothetical protein
VTNYESGLAQGRAEGADAVRKLNQKLANMTADRDEWKQQHDNLLSMYQAEIAKRGAAQETGALPVSCACPAGPGQDCPLSVAECNERMQQRKGAPV